jgi:hypothetical protein
MKTPTRPHALAAATVAVLATLAPSTAYADVPTGATVLPVVGGFLLLAVLVVALIVAATVAVVMRLIRKRRASGVLAPDLPPDASGKEGQQ